MVATTCQFTTLASVGAVLTVVGTILAAFWADLFEFVLYKQLALSPTSYSQGLWEDMPIPMHIDFYMFNWTNPEDITSSDENIRRPKLVEMGPYVFIERRKKVNLVWNDNNETVTFQQNRTWEFDPSQSKGSLDDLVTTLNVPAVTAAFAIESFPPGIKTLLNWAMMLFKTNLTVTKRVNEFLFEGYTDPLLDVAEWLPVGFLPVTIPFDKFGWFYSRNGSETYDGVFNMYTGKSDMKMFGKMGRWNYTNPTSIYDSFCGYVNGSAGEFFPPKPTKDSISLFSTDICRTITLNFKEKVEIDGIKAYRYWGDPHIFDNLTSKPETWCFCPSGDCPPNGAIDVSSCKWGSPAFISFPHFFHADPSYRTSVSGMTPDEKVHQMYIDIEQDIGIPLQVEASMQINILLREYPEYKILKGLPKIYFPIFWFKERARVDDKIGSQLRLITRLPVGGTLLFITISCIGLAILILTSIYYTDFRRKRKGECDLNLVRK